MKRPLLSLAVAAIAVASPLFAAVAAPARSCIGVRMLCAEKRDDGRTIYVKFVHSENKVTHFNVRRNGRQVELNDVREYFNAAKSASWSFAGRPGYKFTFHVQACIRGGFLQKSTCGGWYTFSHTM